MANLAEQAKAELRAEMEGIDANLSPKGAMT
jgi:hypothetical protein